MAERYSIRLEKEQLIFSAAHFITFGDNICERLHGHNYRLMAEVEGTLSEHQYVVDFIALRDLLQQITTELDHHMLLPTEHPTIQVQLEGAEVEVCFEERRWVFPRGDCILLPLENTTAELLAKYIGQRLLVRWEETFSQRPDRLRIGVDENEGQWGLWEFQS